MSAIGRAGRAGRESEGWGQLQRSLYNLFGVMGTVAADFAAFVWLVLQTHAETLNAPGERPAPVRSLLAME